MCACARYPHVANVLYIIMMVKTHSRLAQAFPLNMVGEWVGNLAGDVCDFWRAGPCLLLGGLWGWCLPSW